MQYSTATPATVRESHAKALKREAVTPFRVNARKAGTFRPVTRTELMRALRSK